MNATNCYETPDWALDYADRFWTKVARMPFDEAAARPVFDRLEAYRRDPRVKLEAGEFWNPGQCWVWSGADHDRAHPQRPPMVEVRGRAFTIYDFAYTLQVDAVEWPTIVARPLVCGQPRCVRGGHLHLRRKGNLGAIADDEIEALYQTVYGRRALAHAEVIGNDAIARILGIPGPWINAWIADRIGYTYARNPMPQIDRIARDHGASRAVPVMM